MSPSVEDQLDDPDEDRLLLAKHRVEKLILDSIAGHERSQQRRIGPSGLGTPCQTELVYRLTSPPTQEVSPPQTQWRQHVGTALHASHERAALRLDDPNFMPEKKVFVGDVYLPGQGMVQIHGTADVGLVAEDDGSLIVVDYKHGAKTVLDKMRKNGAPIGERRQLQLYGRGYELLGYRVTHIAILRMPTSGEWWERVWHTEPYDPTVAERVLARATRLGQAIDEFGLDAVLEETQRVNHHCDRCPFALPSENWPQCPTATD